MKFLHLLLLSLCLVEIYGQRSRTTNTEQDANKEAPKPVRGRGRSRFTSTEEFAQVPEQPAPTTSNRRASTRTRIHSNNPKAAADRRARPTEAPRSYAVEEINNDSPIDSFVRQSKPRILTESRFEASTATVSRRPITYEASTDAPPLLDTVAAQEIGFGSTARAILQARGEPLPAKTTTPVVDETYLLSNFGSTIRSLAAASRGAQVIPARTLSRSYTPLQRATPLRSEVPILDREDIPSRHTSLRAEPLPSLRGSNVVLEREPLARPRIGSRARPAEARTIARQESERRPTTEKTVVEDFVRVSAETDIPEAVQGLPEQSELITETQQFEIPNEETLPEEEESGKTSSVEVSTQRSTYAPPPRKVVTSRRGGIRGNVPEDSEATASPRTRAPRTRPTRRPEESVSGPTVSSRTRISKRKFIEDPVVAESRYRGPSIFTVEQYQDVTARSRTGRRIEGRYEGTPVRVPVDLSPTTTVRGRTSGRRATTAGSTTEKATSGSRGRGRSRSSSNESNYSPVTRSSSRRSSNVEETLPSGRRSSTVEETRSSARRSNLIEETRPSGRRASNVESTTIGSRRLNNVEESASYGEKNGNLAATIDTVSKNEVTGSRSGGRRGSSVETLSPTSPRRRGGISRYEVLDSRNSDRASLVQSKKETLSRADVVQARKRTSNRNTPNRPAEPVEETTVYYGEKSIRTDPPETTTASTTTTTTEKFAAKVRSRSRFLDAPPRIDESKLEVLPLFEREPKTLTSNRLRGQRSRSTVGRRQREDHMHVSATENDVKFVEKPTTINAFNRITVTRTESVEASTTRVRLSTRTASPTTTETPRKSSSSFSSSSSSQPTTRVFATSEASDIITKVPEIRGVTRSPPVIKESVVSEINQVTSKSTITRRKKVPKSKAAEVLSRGAKKADIKLTDVGKKKSSEEEVDDEDNYPEPFKALIQAKKHQEESRSTQSTTRSATIAPITKSTNAERVVVTSAASITRGASTGRIVTTTTVAPRKSQELNQIVNDNENELDPKPRISSTTTTATSTTRPTRSRQLPKFSEKPKYQQRQKEKLTRSTEKPSSSGEKHVTKTTFTPRKSYTTKLYSTRPSLEHHPRRKALRSTAFPPSTTPLSLVNRELKYSAKFVKKENKVPETTERSAKVVSSLKPKLFSNRKSSGKENEESAEKNARQLDDVLLIQNAKPTQPIKKINTSRYSSRYRSDTSTRSSVLKSTTSAPFYIPTIPTPAYVPTVPTITPSVTPVDGIVAVKDGDLGMEVISFDDPVNAIPSADLVNGEYLTTDKNLRLSPMVKNGTTEKPISIIERIINSITLISTTAAPNTTTTNPSSSGTTEATTGTSAILKLAAKKTTSKDKTKPDIQTNIIETITSEKPTTIIEKIRTSLSAIQTNEVGTSDLNTVSSPSTTPLSTVTKYSAKYRGSSVGTTALPAPQPLSTSIDPLSVFNEIDKNQVLEKRTIGKLLNILNGLVSTPLPGNSEKLVVVTPKNMLSSAGFVATTLSSQEPIEAISLNSIEERASFADSSDTSSIPPESVSAVNTEPTTSVNIEFSSSNSIVNTDSTTVEGPTQTEQPFTTLPSDITTITPTSIPTTLQDSTTTDIPITTIPPQQQSTATVGGSTSSILYTFPPILPSIPTFEVSPGSVSIFSANELSNYITPEDNLFNTVTIASRVGFDNNVLTSTSTEGATSTTAEPTTNTESATIATTTDMDVSSTTTDSVAVTTTMLSTTLSEEMTTMLTTTTMSSNTSNSSAKLSLSNRSGRILSSDIGDPIENSIEIATPSTTTSTTPDYFIFAVLNNNTILRKKPPTVPNKDIPFIIVGLFPNNTIVRKFPNGTVIPMDPIIKVRGFDTRPNPPPLVEITSNQVTDTTNGMTTPDNNSATVESNRMARLLATEQRTTDPPVPRVVITSTTASTPVSTTPIISTTPPSTSTKGQTVTSTVNSMPTTTPTGSTMSVSTTTVPPSTTLPDTTLFLSTLLPEATTISVSSTTIAPGIVEIMAVPGETRISKSQTTTSTSAESSTAVPSTVDESTTQLFTSTMGEATETIPPSLGEILNGRTVNALNNLIKSEAPPTKAPNYKTLQLNQNSITSSTTDSSTITTAQTTDSEALFTSRILTTERTTESQDSSDRLISSTLISTLMPVSTTTETQSTTTTSSPPTTTMQPTTTEIKSTTRRSITTVPPKTTTEFITFTPANLFPTILTTLFPSLMRNVVTTAESRISTTRAPFTSAEFSNSIGDRFETLSTAGTTAQPTTVLPQSSTSQRISTTTTPATTTRLTTTPPPTTRPTTTQTTTQPTTTTTVTTTRKPKTTPKPKPTTTSPKVSKSDTTTLSTKEETDKLFEELKASGKLKNLNEEQMRNLQEIEKIEKEQSELLKQLSVLTAMFGGPKGRSPNIPAIANPLGGSSNNLANRVIAMAMERDKARTATTTSPPPPTTTAKKQTRSSTRRPNSIQDQLPVTQLEDTTKRSTPSLEDVLKQYNLEGLSTPQPLTSTYGKTDEALVAAILKEHGIGPTTPRALGDKVKEAGVFEEVPTTRKPKPRARPITTTTRPIGGRLMQGLNWLLDILDPPTTRKPAAKKPKAKTQAPKHNAVEEELLTNQPTRITPMVTAAPVTKPNLSQEEIQDLIKQLEAVQNNPNAADQLDFSKIRSLQNLISINEGVQVTHTGQQGATSRATPRPSRAKTTTEKDPFLTEINRKQKSSTVSTLSVSNSIDDDVELISTTVRNRIMPPVSLNPIPGIDDPGSGDSMIRSNLLTAAVNVTRAISSFLGSAIQGAARGFRSLLGTGSTMVGNIAQTSSAVAG